MANYFIKAIYSLVLIGFSSANAGSYEDFFIAAKNDNVGTLTSLLRQGFDPNTRDPKGQTGLMVAIREQSPKAALALIELPGVDINVLNNAGESALMLAALRGDVPLTQRLINRGARINQPGWSPLHYAATGPEPKTVQLLLDRGADIDAGSPNLSTPLMMAAQYGSEESVKLLLQRGADAKRRNQRDLTAVDFARLGQRDSVVKLLEQAQR